MLIFNVKTGPHNNGPTVLKPRYRLSIVYSLKTRLMANMYDY